MKLSIRDPDFISERERAYLEKICNGNPFLIQWNSFYIHEKKSRALLRSLKKYLKELHPQLPKRPVVLLFNPDTLALFQKRDAYDLIVVSSPESSQLFHELSHLYFQSVFPFLEEGLAGYLQMRKGKSGDGLSIDSIYNMVRTNTDSYIPISLLLRETKENLNYFLPEKIGNFDSKFAFYEAVVFAKFVIEQAGMGFYKELLNSNIPLTDDRSIMKAKVEKLITNLESSLAISPSIGKEKRVEKHVNIKDIIELHFMEEKSLKEALEFIEKKLDFELGTTMAVDFLWLCYHLSNIYEKEEKVEPENRLTQKSLNFIDRIQKEGMEINGDLLWLIPELEFRRIRFEPYSLRLEMAKEVETMYRKAFADTSVLYRAYLSYGRYRMFAPPIIGGNINEAINYFKNAIDISSTDEGYAWLARAYREKGASKKAQEAAICSLKINPHNLMAKTIIRDLGHF